MQRKCPICEHLFVPKAHNSKYCGKSCSNKASNGDRLALKEEIKLLKQEVQQLKSENIYLRAQLSVRADSEVTTYKAARHYRDETGST